MSRPQLRKGARTYRLRKRVPADLVAVVGQREVVVSLGTKDPAEAKRRLPDELAKLEAHWPELRRDQSSTLPAADVLGEDKSAVYYSLSEREAAERAQWMYAHWLGLHRDNPSQQRFWLFLVRVAGESMTGRDLFPGDVAVVDKAKPPRNGSIVVACLNGEFTMKTYQRRGERVTLKAENPAFPNIEVSAEADFQVWGVVTGSSRLF